MRRKVALAAWCVALGSAPDRVAAANAFLKVSATIIPHCAVRSFSNMAAASQGVPPIPRPDYQTVFLDLTCTHGQPLLVSVELDEVGTSVRRDGKMRGRLLVHELLRGSLADPAEAPFNAGGSTTLVSVGRIRISVPPARIAQDTMRVTLNY